MNDGRKRLFLVDDHPLVREWLSILINRQLDLTVCGQDENGPSALAAIAASPPDLVIVDLNLNNSSGLELIKALKESHAGVPILVLSMHDESQYAARAFRAGAHGYVNKRETAQKVIEAIRRVLDGKLYLSEKAAEILASRGRRGQAVGRSAIELLSDRELEVFERLGLGTSTRQIADELQVSVKTVQAYCARIKEKIQVTSATELLREAVRWYDAKDADEKRVGSRLTDSGDASR